MKKSLMHRAQDALWNEQELRGYVRELRTAGRYLFALARDLLDGQISLRAMSLVYTTLLSLVPLLALGFSLLKGLGVHNSLEPALARFLAPLGPQGAELSRNIIAFVENIKVGVLGSLGVVLLLYTVLSMIQKVADSFDFIWRVQTRRRLAQRLTEYLSLLLVGPAAIVFALGITASLLSSSAVSWLAAYEPFGFFIYLLGRLIPYVVIVGLFTFLYAFVPNTRVRIGAAFGGGLLAGFLWQSASLAFASFVSGATNYNAIYSGFAILIFLLIWLYVGWLVLLVGCQLACYLQHPERLAPVTAVPQMASRTAELLGLQAMLLIGRRFLAGQPPLSREELQRELPGPAEHVDRALAILLHHGILTEGGAEGRALLPLRDLDTVNLGALWQALREGAESPSRATVAPEVKALVDEAEKRFAHGPGARSVRAWLARD